MLFGGAITDYLSPRLVILIANITRFFLTTIMAFVVFAGVTQLWMLYVFGLFFGIVAGFAVPDDGFVDVIQCGAVPHLAGNSWRIKQMEPNVSICTTWCVGLTDDSMDNLPTRI